MTAMCFRDVQTAVLYLWYQADMDVAEVLPLDLELKLSESFYKWHALNVAYCSSQLLTQNTGLYNCMSNTLDAPEPLT